MGKVYKEYESKLTCVSHSPEKNMDFETGFRLLLFQNYLSALRSRIKDGDLLPGALTENRLILLSDSFLLGSGAERLVEHMSMYGGKLTCALLQECLYTIFEPEVQTCMSIMLSLQGLSSFKLFSVFSPFLSFLTFLGSRTA